MSAIVRAEGGAMGLAPTTWEDAKAMSSALSKARGFVPDSFIGQPHAILAVVMTASELGIGPMRALRSIHVVKGRPVLSSELMLSLAIERGVRPQWLEQSDTRAQLKLTRAGFVDHVHAFSAEDAKRAGLWGKGNWATYPAAMLRARCLSAAMRAYCPDVLGGAYVEGELDDVPAEPRPVERATMRDEPMPVAEAPAGEAFGDEPEPEDGEIVCGASEPADAPVRLDQCRTAEELQAWCAERAAGAIAEHGGPRVVKAARMTAASIGVGIADVDRWLGGAAAETAE